MNDAHENLSSQNGGNGGTEPGTTMTPTGSIFARALSMLSMLSVPPGDDEHAALDELIPDGDEFGPYVRRFSALTMLSASIAAFGLLADSAAVVIGAMLVAPLMVPITAAAGATVLAQNRRLVRALLVIALGVFLAIAVGYLTAAVAGFDIVGRTDLPGEVEGRTFPGLLD
ncbi:MAG: putative membrane protein, partial [Ilumatobacter sp.]